MDNATLRKKLDEFVALGNELDAEAKRRFGHEGMLFHADDGGVHLMSGDDIGGGVTRRQKFIKVSSDRYARWGAGAW